MMGGVWRYDVENAGRRPMYKGLRTNLPREIMAVSFGFVYPYCVACVYTYVFH